MTTINVAVVTPDAEPWPYAVVTVRLIDAGSGGAVEESVVTGISTIFCDADGEGSIVLTPNEDISPAGTFYAFAVENSSPSTVRCIEVPDSGTALSWADAAIQVLVDDPPVFIPAPTLANALKVVRVNSSGDAYELSVAGAGDVAGDTHAATSKTTPVDADEIPLADSAASFALKKLTWANLKATAKTYFDTLYSALGHAHAGSDITSGTVGTARLGSGTANSGTYLRGDQTWASVSSGSGDVVGPASAVDDRIATFDGTTGKLLQDGGTTVAALAPLASPTFTGTPAAPTAAAGTNTTQLATTAFVQTASAIAEPPPYPSASGDITANFAINGATTCTNLAASGRLIMAPMWIGAGAWDRIWVYTTVAAVATWRLGWYPILSTGAPDWANVFDAGTVNMNAATPSGRITISQTPGAGWYYGAILTDAYTANPTVHLYSTQAHQYRGWPQSDGAALAPAIYWTGVTTGALPTTSPGTANISSQMPCIRLRKA